MFETKIRSFRATKINKIEGVIGGYAERCSSFDSRLIVFCSSELGIILLSASLTPACRLSPPISFSKDQAGAKFDDPKRRAYMLKRTQSVQLLDPRGA